MISILRAFARFFAGLVAFALVFPACAGGPALQLQDQDVWVMAGDSITAQRLHTNYIEAFFRTRFPQLRLHFRNSGVGGDRVGRLLQRFDYDVAAWNPTIVSVELGMNDVGAPLSMYLSGSRQLIQKIRALPATPVFFSPGPVNDGSIMGDWKSSRCQKIDPYTQALAGLAQEEGVVFADQYHPLIDLWGQNRRGPVASSIPLGGTSVHVGPIGQYTMAATILKGLHVDGDVSSATISADGRIVEATRCAITELSTQGGKLSFTRLDEAGPWPIPPEDQSALQLLPEMLDLSRYLLRVTGLAEGNYRVTINDQPAAIVSSQTLAAGWNLTRVFDGALGKRSGAILALIDKLQNGLDHDWRTASKAHNAAKLAAAQAAIDACESDLQKLVQPVPLRFSLEKVFTVAPPQLGAFADAGTATGGTTVLYPLANDTIPGDVTITAVSDPAVLIRGRALLVPPGFTGTFTYTVTNGAITDTASVTVAAGVPQPVPRRFNGLIADSDGKVAGQVQLGITTTGTGTAQIRLGARVVIGRFTLRARESAGAGFSPQGRFTVTREDDGTLGFSLAAPNGSLAGSLRPTRAVTRAQRYHVALASINPTIPGGGFAIMIVTANGAINVRGRLPDGQPFTGASSLNDNGSMAFFSVPSGNSGALVAGELVIADLAVTDLTGELAWSKPPQPRGAKGLQLGGVDTILTATGSLYTGVIPLTGPGAVILSGGNLTAPEVDPVTVVSGTPNNPKGLVQLWSTANPVAGKFFARVRVPGTTLAVSGEGLYLPKSHDAWGFFPGAAVGGRIELIVPPASAQ